MLVLKKLFLSRKQLFTLFLLLVLFALLNITCRTLNNKRSRYKEMSQKAKEFLQREVMKLYVNQILEDSLKEDKGLGCDIPKLDPFSSEVMKFVKNKGPINCTTKDWVKCYMTKCKVVPEILNKLPNVRCIYRDILYETDFARTLGTPFEVLGDEEYELYNSDFVSINCSASRGISSLFYGPERWSGYGIGCRRIQRRKPPRGRKHTSNVLILAFDSTSKNAFLRKMPKSYKVLTEELGATILNRYSIVGDGTPAALFPILTGRTELELPEARKSIKNSGHMDQMPFIFYKLKEDGYHTAYLEDMPYIGTFQNRFNGYRRQPADHYLRAFFMEEESTVGPMWRRKDVYCVGDTPRFQVMLNVTEQILKQPGKRFIFTFIADITHEDSNLLGVADEPVAEFLRGLKTQEFLKDTLFIVMGDHGTRYGAIRNTLQGKLEERLPFMAIRIPEVLKTRRPDIEKNLKSNVEVLTTPHDIYATVLDAIAMRQYWRPYKVKGSDLTRGLTLFETIPKNRSCSEAGIEPHWCTCLKWEDVPRFEPLYRRLAQAVVDHINSITEAVRNKCVLRQLTKIHWVLKKIVTNKENILPTNLEHFEGHFSKISTVDMIKKNIYQVKITVGPGEGMFEATVTHMLKEDDILVNTRDISRTNAYHEEPSCISDIYPHMNMFCYCYISPLNRFLGSRN